MKNRHLKNVIFIEDDELDFEVYSNILGSKCPEISITQIETPNSRNLFKYPPHETLLLLDVNLNGVDGINLYKEKLKDLGYTVYIHTSSDNPSDITRAKEAGVQAYFQKQLGHADIEMQLTSILRFFDLNYIEAPLS